MQNTIIIILALTFLLGCAGCAKTVDDAFAENPQFSGIVIAVRDDGFVMEADGADGVEGTVSVNTKGLDAPQLRVGDGVTVSYDGLLQETYPMQPHEVYGIVRESVVK